MTIEDSALRFLQIVALTLPAIALYLTVLTDIYYEHTEASKPYQDPDSDAFEEKGRLRSGPGIKVHRSIVRLNTATEQKDFATALLSLSFFLLSAITLTIAVMADSSLLLQGGMLLTATGFAAMLVALFFTVYVSLEAIR